MGKNAIVPRAENDRALTTVALIAFVIGLLWTVLLIITVSETQLTHTVPGGFLAWIVEIQIRGTSDWPTRIHGDVFYLARFFIITLCVETLGIWGFVRLRRKIKA